MSWSSDTGSSFGDDSYSQPLELSNFHDDPDWPFAVLATLTNELCDVSESNTQGPKSCYIFNCPRSDQKNARTRIY